MCGAVAEKALAGQAHGGEPGLEAVLDDRGDQVVPAGVLALLHGRAEAVQGIEKVLDMPVHGVNAAECIGVNAVGWMA